MTNFVEDSAVGPRLRSKEGFPIQIECTIEYVFQSAFPLERAIVRESRLLVDRARSCENARAARAEWKQHRASSNTAALKAPFVPVRQSAGLRQRTILP